MASEEAKAHVHGSCPRLVRKAAGLAREDFLLPSASSGQRKAATDWARTRAVSNLQQPF